MTDSSHPNPMTGETLTPVDQEQFRKARLAVMDMAYYLMELVENRFTAATLRLGLSSLSTEALDNLLDDLQTLEPELQSLRIMTLSELRTRGSGQLPFGRVLPAL